MLPAKQTSSSRADGVPVDAWTIGLSLIRIGIGILGSSDCIGKMDDKGYLIFTRKACKLVPVLSAAKNNCSQWPLLQDTEGSVWLALDESEWLEIDDHTQQQVGSHIKTAPRCYMVPLWDFIEPVLVNKFEMENLALANSVTKFMLLTEHATGRFHVIYPISIQEKLTVLMTGRRGLSIGRNWNLPLEVLILLPCHLSSDTKLYYC